MAKKKLEIDVTPDAPKSKKSKKEKGEKSQPKMDYGSIYNETMDVIARRQGVESSNLDAGPPISSGMLCTDLQLGGGIRAGMYTSAGDEQSAKTTSVLVMMANFIKAEIPLIEFFDYEGCVVSDTYIGYAKGKHAKLKDLFDLSEVNNWKPGTWVEGMSRTDIDTFEPGHRYGGTGVRTGSLFYKGKVATTKVTFNTGHSLTGNGHKMFVLRNGQMAIKKLEDLMVGEQVLVARKFLDDEPEEWRAVEGFGASVKSRYEVSNKGNVRSLDFTHTVRTISKNGVVSFAKRNVTGRILAPQSVGGHLWVALCSGKTQSKQLVHRIVARTFIGPVPKTKPLVLHWNDTPSDNRLLNIRYGSDQDNSIDRVRRSRATKGIKIHTAKLTEKDLPRIKALRLKGWTLQAIADKFQVSNSTVYQVCEENVWKHTLEDLIPFDVDAEIARDYEVSAVIAVERTGKKQHVFDISLSGVTGDLLPHAIITNGIVTHNSTKNSKGYVRSIVRGAGIKITMDELFGKKNDEGKWIIRPRVRYHAESVGEKFYDYLSEVLRSLPDKKFINKKWWLIFEETKVNKAKYEEYADKTMPKKYGKGLWIEAPDDKLQAVFFVDSYPAMNSTANDEEDVNNGLALQARMHSKHLPRVKGRLAEKMVALIGVNQIRDVPMAMFGPKVQEPGGKALRFNSDVRIRNTPRGSGQPLWPKNFNKQFEEVEKSVEEPGSLDRYRYINTKAIKNKLWTPYRQAWMRIWIEDGSGVARGFDPFWDTMYYLKQTGQLIGKGRKSLSLKLEGIGTGKGIEWSDYKLWVLGDKAQMIAICKKAGFKPMSLRAFCFKQLASGIGEKLYLTQRDVKEGDED